MRSNVCTLILAAASLAPSALLAQPLDLAARGATITATAPGTGVAERVAQLTASVEAVDSAKRTVTLKGPAGDILTLAVGSEVQNFDQIRVGDLLVVRYLEALTLELKKRGTAKRERTERDVTEKARGARRCRRHRTRSTNADRDASGPDASGGPPRP